MALLHILAKIKENRLEKIINELNVSKAEFARSLNIAPQNLNSYLIGERNVGHKLANKIEEKFLVNRAWLLNGQGEMFLYTQESVNSPPENGDKGDSQTSKESGMNISSGELLIELRQLSQSIRSLQNDFDKKLIAM